MGKHIYDRDFKREIGLGNKLASVMLFIHCCTMGESFKWGILNLNTNFLLTKNFFLPIHCLLKSDLLWLIEERRIYSEELIFIANHAYLFMLFYFVFGPFVSFCLDDMFSTVPTLHCKTNKVINIVKNKHKNINMYEIESFNKNTNKSLHFFSLFENKLK